MYNPVHRFSICFDSQQSKYEKKLMGELHKHLDQSIKGIVPVKSVDEENERIYKIKLDNDSPG